MNELISRRLLPRFFLLFTAGLGCVALNSCSSTKNNTARSGSNGGAYASYPADGRYNPYPTAPQGKVTSYQEYTEAPPPPEAKSKSMPKYAEAPPPEEAKPKPKAKSSSATASSATASTSPSKKTTKKKSTTATTASKPASTKSTGSGTVYIVKPKDSLWSLAKKYHTTVSKIKVANGLTSDVIRDGQKLKIP